MTAKARGSTRNPVAPATGLDALLAAPGVKRDKRSWVEMADKLAPVFEGIANGSIEATPSQVNALKEVMLRAHGRVAAASEQQEKPPGIVILPTLGTGKDLQVCPNCKQALVLAAAAPDAA